MKLTLACSDEQAYRIITQETQRQSDHLEMIASENFVSPAVLEAMGSVLTNKYAEGYPGKRYYSGCQYVDEAECLAIERAKLLFNADYVNVQPHSGSQANMAVYFSVLKPGDKILAMNLAHGGHLTHGSPVNFSGQLYQIFPYGVVQDTGLIDYNAVADLAMQHKPQIIVCGASAYARIIDFTRFREIADQSGALLMADMAHIAGLVAVGAHPSPLPYCDFVTTTTHKTLRGPRGGMILSAGKYAEIHSKKLSSLIFPGIQGGPMMHTILAKAVAFAEALRPSFRQYITQVLTNAKVLAATLQEADFNICTGGTDNHLMLIDLRQTTLTGKEGETRLETAGIAVNKNMVPFDPKSPFVTSGLRLGTPALTTRGMKAEEMLQIGQWISQVLKGDEDVWHRVRPLIKKFCGQYPLYVQDEQS